MTMCYKMLLLTLMAQLSDAAGRVSVGLLAEGFREFFVARSVQNKVEENPNRVRQGMLSKRTVQVWERVIRDQPVRYLSPNFVIDEGVSVRWWGKKYELNHSTTPTISRRILHSPCVSGWNSLER